jgi:hypothetical protein
LSILVSEALSEIIIKMTALMRVTPAAGLSVALSITLLVSAGYAGLGLGSGTIVFADRANVGSAKATVGSTLFAGDRLATDQAGSLQVRAAATRLLLSSSSYVIWGEEDGAPAATLTRGTVTFSTAAKAFILHASTAEFRPESDQPTIATVTFLNPKELVVRCSRGAVTIAVEDDVRTISEGTAYRVVLDANAPPAASFPQWGDQKQPRKAGKSKFIVYAIAFTTVATIIALHYALDSPDRP